MKRILVIDGNYFAHKTLGILNMKESVNNLQTSLEISNFNSRLNSDIVALIRKFERFIDNIIFTVDNNSWRKNLTPIRPYYIDITSNIPLQYKENRKIKKDDSTINYDNFNNCLNEFASNISTILNVADITGLEGDDIISLLTLKAKTENFEILLYANDGDLCQTVNNNVFYFKHIKSKYAPEGEFILTLPVYTKLFESDKYTQMLNSGISDLYDLMKLSIYGDYPVKRELNAGIKISAPFKLILTKSICGDAKDNILPILSWKSSTGSVTYKPTEKIIESALKKMELHFTNATCFNLLSETGKDLLLKLINTIITDKEISHSQLKVNNVLSHLYHNIKLNTLSRTIIPIELVNEFDKYFEINKDSTINNIYDFSLLDKLNISVKSKATNIMEQSLPKEFQSL